MSEKRILIIDDDKNVRAILKRKLTSPDRELFIASTVAEGRAQLQQNKISMVILDLGLPDTDGRDLLIELRENAATAHIPVVVVSGKTSTQARTECIALGIDE